MPPETKAELMLRIAKNGGNILIVGGGLGKNLGPTCREHPQIQIWDDQIESIKHKVPSANTHAIIYNSRISHPTVHTLRTFAKKRSVTLFPMMSVREIRDAIDLLINPVPNDQEMSDISQPVTNGAQPITDGVQPINEQVVEQESVTKRPSPGVVSGFIFAHYDKSIDYSVMGSKIKEAKRLLKLMNDEGIPSTQASVANLLGQILISMDQKPEIAQTVVEEPKPPQKTEKTQKVKQPTPAKLEPKTVTNGDDFIEAEKMLTDARAAIDLLLDFIPKLRKEVELRRKTEQKILEFLGENRTS